MAIMSSFALRIPDDIKTWLSQRAARYGGSVNGEIVRLLRERMDTEIRPRA